jgi:hypothetical protein
VDDDPSEPPELSPSDAGHAGELVGACSDMALRYFFSKSWRHRLKGIKMLGDEIAALTGNVTDIVIRYCSILKKPIGDPKRPVFEAAIQEFQKVCRVHHVRDAELSRCFLEVKDAFVTWMQRPPSGKVVVDFLVWLHENGCWDVLVKLLEQPLQRPTEWQLAKCQIETLIEIAVRNPSKPLTSLPGAELPILMGFLKPHLASTNPKLKQAALELVVVLDTMNRDSVRDLIAGFDSLLQETVLKALADAQH